MRLEGFQDPGFSGSTSTGTPYIHGKKTCNGGFLPPIFLGMVKLAPIKMVMIGGWFISVLPTLNNLFSCRFSLQPKPWNDWNLGCCSTAKDDYCG